MLLCLSWPALARAHVDVQTPWPQQAVLVYTSSLGVPATLTFQRHQSQYTVVAQSDAVLWSWRFVAEGVLHSGVLAMQQYQDIRQGRLYARAERRQDRLYYGKNSLSMQQMALTGPVFDVFSLAWQLALQPQAIPPVAYLTNGKSAYALSAPVLLGERETSLGKRRQRVREYRFSHGRGQIVYAISTDVPHLPVRIRYDDDSHSYALELHSAVWNGQKVW